MDVAKTVAKTVEPKTVAETVAETVEPKMFVITDSSIPTKIGAHLMDQKDIFLQPFVVSVSGHTLMLHLGIVRLHSEELSKHWVGTRILYTLIPENFYFLCAIKKYMYTGLLEIPRDNLIAFNDVVVKLKLESLMRDIADNITFESTDELFDAFRRAVESDNTYMEQTAFNEFVRTFSKIPLEKVLSFVSVLSTDQMEFLFKRESSHGTSESELRLVSTLDKWRCDKGASLSKMLLSHIKLELISASVLITQVRPLGLLTDDAYITLLEKIGLESCKEKPSAEEIFICNVADPVPSGYRIVTKEEFNTDEFKKALANQIQSGMKCTGTTITTNSYLFVFSDEIVKRHRETVLHDGTNCSLIMQNGRYYRSSVSDQASFSLANHGISNNDAYMCVRR